MGKKRTMLLGALCAAVAACTAGRPGAVGESVPGRAAPAAPDSREGRFELVASGPRSAGEALVTGAEKPNGTQYRYRESVPAGTPGFVSRTRGPQRLWIADSTASGWLAFYRTPPAEDWRNSAFSAALFDADGTLQWRVDLGALLSRPTHLEIQDIRLGEDGDLYINEACQTYARDAERACSALLRVDPARGRVRWRTAPLVSNNVLLLDGRFIVAGYGFTAEPDSLFLVSRADGEVLDRLGLDTAHQYLERVGGDVIVLTNARYHRIRIR